MANETGKIVRDLHALLTREAEVIRTAAFDRLAGIEVEKSALADRLVACDPAPTAAALSDLQAKAARNGVLLEAASRGVANARRQMEDIQAAARGFSSYDHAGREAHIGAAPASGADRRV
jgi:hypothetical protein